MSKPQILGVIPARYDSSRFPGKPLVDIRGISMIERVYRQCEQSRYLTEVVVATDDERIFEHVKAFGGAVRMTGSQHRSGTERVGEVAHEFEQIDWVVNVQGDEPFIDPRQIDLLCQTLLDTSGAEIATLIKLISDSTQLQNPNVVKVVTDFQGKALYFSRSTIPFWRKDSDPQRWTQKTNYYKHLGIYGFKRSTLLKLVDLPASPLEEAESLEQLRWLEHGYGLQTAITELEAQAVDSPEDLDKL